MATDLLKKYISGTKPVIDHWYLLNCPGAGQFFYATGTFFCTISPSKKNGKALGFKKGAYRSTLASHGFQQCFEHGLAGKHSVGCLLNHHRLRAVDHVIGYHHIPAHGQAVHEIRLIGQCHLFRAYRPGRVL
jgi:hypothetical protein